MRTHFVCLRLVVCKCVPWHAVCRACDMHDQACEKCVAVTMGFKCRSSRWQWQPGGNQWSESVRTCKVSHKALPCANTSPVAAQHMQGQLNLLHLRALVIAKHPDTASISSEVEGRVSVTACLLFRYVAYILNPKPRRGLLPAVATFRRARSAVASRPTAKVTRKRLRLAHWHRKGCLGEAS